MTRIPAPDTLTRSKIAGSAHRRARLRDSSTGSRLASPTLEMGLNLPARLVVLYDLQYFDGTDFKPLMVNTVWQRAGRAGRRGLDDRGEVLLIGAAWDREIDRYAEGRFERITSGLADRRALAEQMLAEVSSGLARTRSQLHRRFAQSLAAHQGRLPNIDHVLTEMTDSGMVTEVSDDDEKAPRPCAQTLDAARCVRLQNWAVQPFSGS